jgi:hypothetical protein
MNAAAEIVRSHRWEIASLGIAPFTCTGMTECRHDMGGGRSKAGGSCDYCGQGILYVFHILSSDGRKFKVGCDCVAHTHDAAESIVVKAKRLLREHKRAKAGEGRAAKRKAAAEARAAQWQADRETNLAALATDPLYLRVKAVAGLATRQAEGYGVGFMVDMRDNMERWGGLTTKQETAVLRVLERIENNPARLAASAHVGAIGERIKIKGTVEFSRCIYAGDGSVYDPDRYVNKVRTEDGQALTWFGNYALKQDAAIEGTATVKDHGEYQGERQTTIKNPRWKAPA